MRNRAIVLALIVVSIINAGGWIFANQVDENAVQGVQLAHELETMGLCVNALNSLERGDVETATRLLEHRLASSLSVADRVAASGITIDQAIPNLKESARRAHDYVERHEIAPGARQEARKLVEHLDAM